MKYHEKTTQKVSTKKSINSLAKSLAIVVISLFLTCVVMTGIAFLSQGILNASTSENFLDGILKGRIYLIYFEPALWKLFPGFTAIRLYSLFNLLSLLIMLPSIGVIFLFFKIVLRYSFLAVSSLCIIAGTLPYIVCFFPFSSNTSVIQIASTAVTIILSSFYGYLAALVFSTAELLVLVTLPPKSPLPLTKTVVASGQPPA